MKQVNEALTGYMMRTLCTRARAQSSHVRRQDRNVNGKCPPASSDSSVSVAVCIKDPGMPASIAAF